jgi:hypothetical protein
MSYDKCSKEKKNLNLTCTYSLVQRDGESFDWNRTSSLYQQRRSLPLNLNRTSDTIYIVLHIFKSHQNKYNNYKILSQILPAAKVILVINSQILGIFFLLFFCWKEKDVGIERDSDLRSSFLFFSFFKKSVGYGLLWHLKLCSSRDFEVPFNLCVFVFVFLCHKLV